MKLGELWSVRSDHDRFTGCVAKRGRMPPAKAPFTAAYAATATTTCTACQGQPTSAMAASVW